MTGSASSIEHRRVQHQLRAVLLTYYPALPQLFSSLDRAITLAFLRRFPTPHDAERLTVARLARFLHREGYSGRTHPGVLLARLRAHPMTPSDGTEAARARTALALGDLLERLSAVLAGYDGAIAALVTRHPDVAVFGTFPGAGDVTVATLIAEIGTIGTASPHPAACSPKQGWPR